MIGGKFFFGEIWQEHRITMQKYYLQKEAQYALDFIINGVMDPVISPDSRYGGIMGASDVEINPDTDILGGDEILLKDSNNNLIGRILAFPQDAPTSLKFEGENSERIISPNHGVLDAPFRSPYNMVLNFSKDPNESSLIDIDIRLEQTILGRDIVVQTHSAVRLRNASGHISRRFMKYAYNRNRKYDHKPNTN